MSSTTLRIAKDRSIVFAIFQANAVSGAVACHAATLPQGNTDVAPTTFLPNSALFLMDSITGVIILVTFQCVQFRGREILDLPRRSAYTCTIPKKE